MRPILLPILALAACGQSVEETNRAGPDQPGWTGPPAEAATGRLDRSRAGSAAPSTGFEDPDGAPASLADFRGGPVLVNLWATWCGPCIKELPTLQSLDQDQSLDGELGVIAVSQDIGPQTSVKAFLADKKLRDFAAFHDPDMGLTTALGVQIMPTTVLYDAEGREVWRYVGDLDWTGEEAKKLAEGKEETAKP